MKFGKQAALAQMLSERGLSAFVRACAGFSPEGRFFADVCLWKPGTDGWKAGCHLKMGEGWGIMNSIKNTDR